MIEIQSTKDYVERVTELNDQIHKDDSIENEFLGKQLLFRGQANAGWTLLPSLGRMDSDYHNERAASSAEKDMIELAKYKMPDVFNRQMLPLERLALLQHYGMPTRLLDISDSALVALYFACSSEMSSQGEVLVFRNSEYSATTYPIIQAAADTCYLMVGSFYNLEWFLENALNQDYFAIQKRSVLETHTTDEQKADWVKTCYEKLLYVYAPVHVGRQMSQDGRYIIFINEIKQLSVEGTSSYFFMDRIKEIPKDHKDIIERIIIPGKAKERILMDLAVLGITRSKLFCDSPDVLCKEIGEKCKKVLLGKETW